MVKNAQQMKIIKRKLSENNAMYFHSEISAPKVYSNDTIKTVQVIMRKFLLVFLFNNTMPRSCTDNSQAAQQVSEVRVAIHFPGCSLSPWLVNLHYSVWFTVYDSFFSQSTALLGFCYREVLKNLFQVHKEVPDSFLILGETESL